MYIRYFIKITNIYSTKMFSFVFRQTILSPMFHLIQYIITIMLVVGWKLKVYKNNFQLRVKCVHPPLSGFYTTYRCHVITVMSRGISQVSRNQSSLLNQHNIPIHSNKTVRVYGYFSNKAVTTLLIISIDMFIFCLPEVDLEEGQSCPKPCIPPTSECLGIFVNLYTNSIIKYIFCIST